jgi:hypothetical protein
VKHILVKHCESRRPVSWKDDNIRRTPEEAMTRIKGKGDNDYLTAMALRCNRVFGADPQWPRDFRGSCRARK